MIPELSGIYRWFADTEVGSASDRYAAWANGVANDPELLALIDGLGGVKRQPHLVFAAARYIGISAETPFDLFRIKLIAAWPRARQIILGRHTQTNEPCRCAVLLPILAALPQPLALLEVGASAGLCLFPDRYSYRYGEHRVDPPAGPSPVVLDCEPHGPVPLPDRVPTVVWRAGIDQHPLDVNNAFDMRWLDMFVWPGQDERRQRLGAAVDLARADPPRLIKGDLNDLVADVAAQAPADATFVLMHSAVMPYLSPEARAEFVATARNLPGHWVSMEGRTVAPLSGGFVPPSPDPGRTLFVVESDGVPMAYAGSQGQSLYWL